MTKITVDKALIEQAIDAAFSPYCTQDLAILVPALRAVLAEPEVEPVFWEWRWFDANPNTVTFNQWSEWRRVEPRNHLCSVEDSLNEFRAYIANGHRYELRALYTSPPPPAEPADHSQKGYKIVPIKPPEDALAEPAVEPVAFLHDDGYWTAAKTDSGRTLNDKLHFAGSTKVAVFTSPPPPAEVPLLSDEEIDNIFSDTIDKFESGEVAYESVGFARAIERAVRQKAGFA